MKQCQHMRKYRSGKKTMVNKGYHKNRSMGVYIYRKGLGGKHIGDEAAHIKSMDKQMEFATQKLLKDKGDIETLRVTDPSDFVAFEWKKGKGTTFPDPYRMFPPILDNTLAPEQLKQVRKLRDDKNFSASPSDMVQLDQADIATLRKKYDEAIAKNIASFTFKGREVLTNYAKYMLQYIDMVKGNK